MSWSVSATGFAAAIMPVIEDQFANCRCAVAAEEATRQSVRAAIAFALNGCSPAVAVKVSAQGHHTTYGTEQMETFTVSVEPIYGFLSA